MPNKKLFTKGILQFNFRLRKESTSREGTYNKTTNQNPLVHNSGGTIRPDKHHFSGVQHHQIKRNKE